MSDEILTIKEVSNFLKVNERTVYCLASVKKIPAFKVGNSWPCRKNDIENWILSQTNDDGEYQ